MKLDYLTKLRLANQSLELLRQRKFWQEQASRVRALISKQSGDNGQPNPYPISGGICEHWKPFQKDAVLYCVEQQNRCTNEALECHRKSGRRDHTFRALLQNIAP
jgi:hypothetical protein